jgi:hypothetical protein
MNFLEAMATGRPFKRASWHEYVTGIRKGCADGRYQAVLYWKDEQSPSGTRHAIQVAELLAEDWEVQSPQISVSEAQIRAALRDNIGTLVEVGSKAFIDSMCDALRVPLG